MLVEKLDALVVEFYDVPCTGRNTLFHEYLNSSYETQSFYTICRDGFMFRTLAINFKGCRLYRQSNTISFKFFVTLSFIRNV